MKKLNLLYLLFICLGISFTSVIIWYEIKLQGAKPFWEKAKLEFKQNKYQESIEDYTKAIELNPQNPNLYNNRGLSKWNINDFKGAIQDCDKAIELDKNCESAYNNRALAKNYLNDYQGAIQDCYMAIKLNKGDEYNYANLGYARLQLRDYKKAIEAFDSSIGFRATAKVYYNRGMAKIELGDSTGGGLDLTKAKEMEDTVVNKQ